MAAQFTSCRPARFAVPLVCLFVWLLLGGADNNGYWPDKPPDR